MYLHTYKQSDFLLKLDLLANIEPTESNFLTCYLDLRGGRKHALTVFRRMKKNLRDKLDARQKIDFEHAVKMIEDHLNVARSKSSSIMVFCRSILGGQFFQALPISLPLGNRLFFQPKPRIDASIRKSMLTGFTNKSQPELEMLKHADISTGNSNAMHFSDEKVDYSSHNKRTGSSFDLVA
jgi:hypothetical protein